MKWIGNTYFHDDGRATSGHVTEDLVGGATRYDAWFRYQSCGIFEDLDGARKAVEAQFERSKDPV